jgi:hypothetical protein
MPATHHFPRQDWGVAGVGWLECREAGLPKTAFRGILVPVAFNQGETDMGDKGKRDKGKREQQKKAQRTPEEKRRLKREKKEERKNR